MQAVIGHSSTPDKPDRASASLLSSRSRVPHDYCAATDRERLLNMRVVRKYRRSTPMFCHPATHLFATSELIDTPALMTQIVCVHV